MQPAALQPFDALPDHARLWIYGFENPLGESDQCIISERLSAFLGQWHSHRVDVHGAFAVLHERFVVMAGASRDGLSGCSIDSSVDNFKYLRDHHGLDGLNRSLIFYRDADDMIHAIDRDEFREAVARGACGPDTVVFDTTIQTLGELRQGALERRAADSWHAKLAGIG